MRRRHPECPGSDSSDRSVAADVLLREEPDEDENDEEDEDDRKEDDEVTTMATRSERVLCMERNSFLRATS